MRRWLCLSFENAERKIKTYVTNRFMGDIIVNRKYITKAGIACGKRCVYGEENICGERFEI